jgi:hypothetical protein
MVLIGRFGFPLLAAALYRSAVARWIPVAIGVAFVSFFAPINEGFGASLLAIALAGVAYGGRERMTVVPSSATA